MLQPSPIFETPLMRAFLRTLLFTVGLEAVFYRLLTIPAGPAGRAWQLDLHVSTGRAGVTLFFLAFIALLPTLITIAYATLRHPAWPGALNGAISIGLLTASALAVSASMGPRGPAFALGFTALATLLCLAMLAGLYERCGEGWSRAFAVALGCALVCLALAESGGLASSIGLIPRAPAITSAALAAGWWLLFAAGVLAFLAFSPQGREAGSPGIRAAAWGISTVTSFGLAFGVLFHPALLRRLAAAFDAGRAGASPGVLRTSAAAAALFLVTITAVRCLPRSRSRPVGIGLIFLVLAGYPREVAYQHLLSLLGVILITGSAPPIRPKMAFAAAGSRPAPYQRGVEPPSISIHLGTPRSRDE